MYYPKVGQTVRVVGQWRGQKYDITGIVVRTGVRVRSGAVLGQIQTTSGKIMWVPWSLQYVKFEPVQIEKR